LELRLVEGLPRVQARKYYEQADLVVDQVLVGWYGGLAVEAMALGKPVVAFIREDDLGFAPEAMRHDLPIISASPDTLAATLREWLTVRRAELVELGRRSRAFVERWHDPERIAERLKRDYEAILAGRRA
jgi:glycosyltransferase involved in cell wall biosynthesis